MADRKPLLPPDALKDVRIGISVSESADLSRLGFIENHLRLAVAEIARCVLVSGGSLSYGGHLAPNGYTSFLMDEVHRYARRDRPLHICLAWPEHRKLPLSAIETHRHELGLFGQIICLDINGQIIDCKSERVEEPQPVADQDTSKRSLTALRQFMGTYTQGRILIGGKRSGFLGKMPGVMEEGIISLELGQPLYLAGGFGGVTADMTFALGIGGDRWMPEYIDANAPDERFLAGLSYLKKFRKNEWKGLNNGLSDAENRQLAATHRPGEIATLVSLGLGRLFGQG